MKFAYSLLFSLIIAGAAFAQAQPAQNVKVMFINTELFSVKGGITRYVNALEQVDAPFNPAREELRAKIARHDALAREVVDLESKINAAAPNAPTRPALIKQMDAKIEEGRALETEIKRKQEDNRANREKRLVQVVTPIQAEISKALQDYAKQNGYTVILDVSKMGAAIVAFDEKADVTKEFVTWFNARQPRPGVQ